MIHYNNPEYAKEMQNVVPPKTHELTHLLQRVNYNYDIQDSLDFEHKDIFQRLIWHYENLVHNNEVNVPELKRLLSEKKLIQTEMDAIVVGSWGKTIEQHDYSRLCDEINEIEQQIHKLIEKL